MMFIQSLIIIITDAIEYKASEYGGTIDDSVDDCFVVGCAVVGYGAACEFVS